MSKETRAFQLVPGSNDKERTEIAIRHINTVSKSLYNQAEIEQLRDIVLNHIASPYIFNAAYLTRKYTGLSKADDNLRLYHERVNEIANLAEALKEQPPELNTYGKFYPTYKKMLDAYAGANPDSDHHTALLVGSLSSDTATEFIRTVRSTFSDPRCLVVDIENAEVGKRTQDHRGQFALADGRSLPFSGSIDTIQTNVLFPHLDSFQAGASCSDSRSQLFQSFYTALKPGGRLIMIEYINPRDQRSVKPLELRQELKQTGFTNISFETAQMVVFRSDLARFFAGTSRDLPESIRVLSASSAAISAEKPKLPELLVL